MMKKAIRSIVIGAVIICSIILCYQIFNKISAKTISDMIDNEEDGTGGTTKIPVNVEDIVKGLGTSIDYAVFANKFTQQTHMEGNIAVKDAYISQIFNFTSAVIKVNRSNTYSITVKNEKEGNIADGNFKFALFTKSLNSETGKEEYTRTKHDIITVTTKNGEGTANFKDLNPDIKYYIFELDENNNPIMNNTVTSDGMTVKYGDEEIIIGESNLKNANTSYIENIKQWTNHAADGNDGESPKLVIPKKEYLNLSTDANGNLSHNNSGIVQDLDNKKLELIVIDDDGKNYTVVNDNENGGYKLQERANEYKTIDFNSEFQKLNSFSSILYNTATSSDEVNVVNLDADGNISVDGQANGLNYGRAESETLELSEYLKDNKYLVINVDMSDIDNIELSNLINWGDLDGTISWNTVSTRILWNFYNKDKNTPYTGNIRIKKNNIIGTILAPSANIIVDTTINASVISNEVSNPGGEIHKSQFNQSRMKRRISCYNSIQKVEPGSEKIKININKIDKNTSKNLENTEFEIIIKNNEKNIFDKTEKTDENGNINIEEIELPKEEQEYKVILKEITPPDGYNASGDIEFNINVVMKDGKYQLKDEEVFNNNNAEITINNNFINIKVTNEKIEDIKGNFNIKLIKKDAKNEQVLNDIIFDIDVIDENENKIDLINEVTGEKIKLEDLITGSENEDGVISIKNIKIEDAKKYTIILKERKNDKYIEIDPIEINIETISENNEYILGNVSLKDNSREDIVLEKENNTIILEVKNKKKITGTYNIKIKKINSISKEGLNGVKFHIKIYDNENNVIFDDDMTTREINGNAGYIDINNRIIKEPGTHRCEITEIESLDGYKKFNQEIIAEIEVGLNDSEEKYEVKDVKNKGLFSENLKMEKEEDGNGVLIVLANDPSVKIEDVKPSGPSFLPQTGDFDIIIKIISTMLIINLIIGTTIFIYKKRK